MNRTGPLTRAGEQNFLDTGPRQVVLYVKFKSATEIQILIGVKLGKFDLNSRHWYYSSSRRAGDLGSQSTTTDKNRRRLGRANLSESGDVQEPRFKQRINGRPEH